MYGSPHTASLPILWVCKNAPAKWLGHISVSKKCLAEFAAAAAHKVKSIFGRGV